jgi:threonine/homoserine/homoserine lactone efflux protein
MHAAFPSLPTFLAFVGAGLILAMTPGPDMALIVTRSLSGGRGNGFAALAGVSGGLLVHTLAAALGLSALIAASARAYDALKIVGALYLLWLALGALRHGAALKLEAARGAGERGLAGAGLAGLLINLTNPKIIIFFVTFLPQFVDAGDVDAGAKFLTLGLVFIVIGVAVNGLIVLVASRFVAAARASPRALRLFDFGFAGLMSAFAARLLWTQGR